ncbi:hypothetical protein J3A78_003839 [Streptomyces sp. PvR006]|uniref:hypothetical protein n=1 Tax=Streptomyces sp. PvR006 TaxID=2817860 RepID=UPI001AE1D927|nr:hypothetical protein [Streptomyces sp. PvR006]MBP2583361.1 hypothetical protein [Streptomyces sp. PvR006]
MFGLTTISRLRRITAQRDENARLAIQAVAAASDTAAASFIREARMQRRLARALRAAARWRAHAAVERRTVRVLADQLLDATSGESTAARAMLGLPQDGPWQRAVDGLNALIDAQIPFHVEPDGHISNPCGDEHIEYDRAAGRWVLVHDDEARADLPDEHRHITQRAG